MRIPSSLFCSFPLTIVLTFVEIFTVAAFKLSFVQVCLSSGVVQFSQEKFCNSFILTTLLYPGRWLSHEHSKTNLRVREDEIILWRSWTPEVSVWNFVNFDDVYDMHDYPKFVLFWISPYIFGILQFSLRLILYNNLKAT